VIWPLSHLIELVRFSSIDRRFSVDARRTGYDPDELAGRALAVAISQLGFGEVGGNNRGHHVAKYIAPAKPPANWCAGFVGWCYEEAARGLELAMPFQRSLGAKRLGKNVGAEGRLFRDPALARPGDLMVFHRGTQGSWTGHVGIVERPADGAVHTIEGNAGPQVMRRMRFVDRDRFAFFASLRSG